MQIPNEVLHDGPPFRLWVIQSLEKLDRDLKSLLGNRTEHNKDTGFTVPRPRTYKALYFSALLLVAGAVILWPSLIRLFTR